MLVSLGLAVTAVAAGASYLVLLKGSIPALIAWVVLGAIIGLILGGTSGRPYAVLHGLLGGIAGATLAAVFFLKVRPEGASITFTRAVVTGIGAALIALVVRFFPRATPAD